MAAPCAPPAFARKKLPARSVAVSTAAFASTTTAQHFVVSHAEQRGSDTEYDDDGIEMASAIIDDQLYLGSARAVESADFLIDHGIKIVINVSTNKVCLPKEVRRSRHQRPHGPTTGLPRQDTEPGNHLMSAPNDESDPDAPLGPATEGRIQVFHYPVRDALDENIRRIFLMCFSLIDEALARGDKVLVHCHKGISRSSTVVIAYLVHRYKWTASEALKYVRQRRPAVEPNLAFMEVLQQDQEFLLRTTTTAMKFPLVIRNVHPSVTEEVVKDVFGAFGTCRVQLRGSGSGDAPARSGIGVVMFDKEEAAARAEHELHNMRHERLAPDGGKVIVRRAPSMSCSGPSPNSATGAAKEKRPHKPLARPAGSDDSSGGTEDQRQAHNDSIGGGKKKPRSSEGKSVHVDPSAGVVRGRESVNEQRRRAEMHEDSSSAEDAERSKGRTRPSGGDKRRPPTKRNTGARTSDERRRSSGGESNGAIRR